MPDSSRIAILTFVLAGAIAGAPGICPATDTRQFGDGWAFPIDGAVALASLTALSDGHLKKMADSLHVLAATKTARSASWDGIRKPLAELGRRTIPALNWFARPDGSYWSIQNGRESGNLSTRDYFPRVMAGETVVGELVVSKATGKPVAIVAVPIASEHGSPVGVLGASVYLDQLAALINREMALDDTMIFFSFDETALVALDWDPSMIFLRPDDSGEQELIRAFDTMMQNDSGMVRYRFRGRERTVLYRKSSLTGWWYAFGVLQKAPKPKQPGR